MFLRCYGISMKNKCVFLSVGYPQKRKNIFEKILYRRTKCLDEFRGPPTVWDKSITPLTIINCFRDAQCLSSTQQAELDRLSETYRLTKDDDIRATAAEEAIAAEILATFADTECFGCQSVGDTLLLEAESITPPAEKLVEILRMVRYRERG